MTGLLYTTEAVFVFVCLFLILLILIQKGRGGGLASAFGGGGGQTAFGTKTGDVLTWTTSIVFGIFLILAVALNLIANQIDRTRYGVRTPTTLPAVPGQGSSLPAAPQGEPAIRQPEAGSSAATGIPSPASTAPAPTVMTTTTAPSAAPAPTAPVTPAPISVPTSMTAPAVPTTLP